ncbi:MAG TPA: helix-hairpin-helix domain-containing protein, partial [Desulfatirhabdiaceae bacterium]|nr:helix-hairpin-helix domain-containing protein [Desulfatirhabdiaceae bacterium]
MDSNPPQLTELSGQIERITYSNDENGYTVARVKVYGQKDLVSVIGNFISPTPGEIVLMKGLWTTHPKFGEQFKVVHYQTRVPATVYGIKKYLGSGLIKGIGPKIAERIVSSFGKETLNVIEQDTEKLNQIDGIGEKRVAMIKKAWDDQKEIREVMLFLQSHGVSPAYAAKIFKHYGNDSIKTVQENPYRLAMDIFGIGFITADRIAEKLGFSKDSELRAKAGVIYVLHQLSDEGHVFYPEPQLIEKSRETLQTEPDIIQQAIIRLTEEAHLVLDELPAGDELFKGARTAVYLRKYHVCETRTAARLKM